MTKTVIKIVSAFAALFFAQSAIAQDFGAAPADYEYAVHDYVEARLVDSRGAQVQFQGRPYPVIATFRRGQAFAAWAVDVRIRANINGGRRGGFVPHTVILIDGEAVAFEDDIYDVERIRPNRIARR